MFKRILPLLGLLAFASAHAAETQSCNQEPVVVDATDGLPTDANGAHIVGFGAAVEMAVAYEGCKAATRIEVDLPSELTVVSAPPGCETASSGALVCDSPKAEELSDGSVRQLVEYRVRAREKGQGRDAQEKIELSWPVRAKYSSASKTSSLMRFTSAETELTTTTQDATIQSHSYIAILTPANGGTLGPVAPGANFVISTAIDYNDNFQGATMDLASSFSYVSYAPYNSESCSGSGDTVTCTGGSSGTHEVDLTWQAPTTPGTYSGLYWAETCDSGSPADCTTDTHNFDIVVEDTSCSVAQAVAHQSGYMNDDVYADKPFEYLIDVSAPSGNGSDADSITAEVSLASGMAYNGFSGTNWSCSESGGIVTCNYSGTLTPGQSAPQLALQITAPSSAGFYDSSFDVSSSTCSGANDLYTVEVKGTDSSFANVVSTKSGPSNVYMGDNFTWTINLDSQGPNAAENYVLTDNLPAGTSFVGVTADSPLSCSHSSGTVTCSASSLAQGLYSIAITVTADTTGTLTNTCSATVTAGATDDTACSDSVTSEIPPADVSLNKIAPTSVTAGSSFTYSMRVSNLGPGSASGISISDNLPSGVTYNSYSGSGWVCSVVSGSASCNYGFSVASGGQTNWLHIDVTAPNEPTSLTNCGSTSANETDPDTSNNSDCASSTVDARIDLAISKTGPSSVDATDTFSYTIDVSNGGPSTANGVTVNDTLPSDLSFNGASGTGWTCSESGGTVNCSLSGGLAGGNSASPITIDVTAGSEGGNVFNCANVTGNETETNGGNNDDCQATVINALSDVSIMKTGPASADAAGSITYTLEASNSGPSTATGVTVVDSLPSGATFNSAGGTGWSCSNSGGTVTCSRSNIAGGASAPLITINATAPDEGGGITNCADISANESDPATGNNSDCASTTVDPIADLAISKTGPSTVNAGASVSYALDVSNLGPSTGTGVVVTDSLPAELTFTGASGSGWSCSQSSGTVTCNLGSGLAGGASASTITINATAQDEPVSINNCANVSATEPDPASGNNTSCQATTIEALTDLAVSKTGPASVDASNSFSYTIDISNAGPSTANGVTVTDSLPSSLTFNSVSGSGWSCSQSGGTVTCSLGSGLAGGASASAITIGVTAGDEGTSINNCATVSGNEPESNAGNNTNCQATTVNAVADVSIVKTGPGTVDAASNFSYSLEAFNTGPSTATGVTVVDSLPSGVTFDSAGGTGWSCSHAGGTVTCSRSSITGGASAPLITINAIAPNGGGDITNCADISANESDPNTGDNSSCSTDSVNPVADLSVAKTASVAEVLAGQPYQYEITLNNSGPSSASNVVVDDTLPSGVTFLSASADSPLTCSESGGIVSCVASTLPVGTYSMMINVEAPTTPGDITNTCVVATDTDDPTPIAAGDCNDGGVTVNPAADIQVSKTSTPDPVLAGEPFTYQIQIDQQGPNAATNVSVDDPLPSGVTFVSASADSPLSCGESGGTVTCTAATLSVGTYLVNIDVLAPDTPGDITNTCVVASDTGDPNPPQPGDCEDVSTVDPAADLSVSKIANVTEVPAGEPYQYTISVSNSGPNDATNVEITDTLPAGVSIDGATTWTNAPFDCSASGGTVTCLAATVPIGSHDITINVLAPDDPGMITNTCVVASDTGDPTPIQPDECNDPGVEVLPAADLSIVKSSSVTEVLAGEDFDFILTLTNDGPSAAENVVITDNLPADVTFQSVSADTPLSCINSAGTVECSAASVPVGSYAVTITVTAPNQPGTVLNTCVANSDTTDPSDGSPGVEGEACNDVEVTVNPAADLIVDKTYSPDPVLAGEPFVYQISIENLGPNAAENVEISDPLPAEVTFVGLTSSDPALVCGESAGTITCNATTLPIGIYTVDVEVTAPETTGDITNTCVVTTDTGDPNPIQPADCEVVTPVDPAADLSFAKTAASASTGDPITEIDAGEAFLWVIDAENLGPSPSENLVISDSVPSAFTVQGATGSSSTGGTVTCSISGTHDVQCQLASLPAGETVRVEVEVTAPDQGGTYTNVCTYTADTEDPRPSVCDGNVVVNPISDVAVSLAAFSDPQGYIDDPISQTPVGSLDAGSEGLYVATITNNGPSDAQGVDLVADLAAEYTNLVAVGASQPDCVASGQSLACAFGDLAVGDSIEALVQMTAPELAGPLTTEATVTSTTDDRDLANNTASHILDIQEDPVIGLAKAQTLVEHIGNGEFESSVMFTIINYGNVPLSNVQLTDDFSNTFPAGVPWTVSDLEVTGDLTAVNPNYDGVQDTSLLAGTETLPVDGEAFVRVKVQFIPGTETGPFWNQAEAHALSTLGADVTDISHDGVDPVPDNTDPGNWSDPTPIQYEEDPAIGVAKWVEGRSYLPNGQQRFELAIKVENWGNVPLDSVQLLDNLVYTFTPEETLQEHGRLAANNVDDTILDGVENLTIQGDLTSVNSGFDGVGDTALLTGIEMLPVGGSATIRFDVLVSPTATDYGPYYNRALGSGWSPSSIRAEDYSQEGQDVNPSSSGDPTDDNEPTLLWALHSDVSVSKQFVSDNAGVGDTLSWEVLVSNLGPDPAHELVLTDTLPDNVTYENVQVLSGPAFNCAVSGQVITCDTAELGVGQSATIQVDATAPDSAQEVINVCEASTASPDPDLSNNQCESAAYVGPRAELSVSKTALSSTVLAGERVDYLITVNNAGPNAAEDVVVTDDLPAGTQFVDVSADTPFACSGSGGVVSCSADVLPVGTFDIQIGVLAPLEAGPITNTCVVESSTTDPTPFDPADCDSGPVNVEEAANLSISKTASSDVVSSGSDFSYLILVENSGPNAAEDVLVEDPLPAELTFVDVAADAPFSCAFGGGTVECSAASLDVGSYMIEIMVTAPTQTGTINNVCVFSSSTGDPDPVDPADCDSGDVEITPGAGLSLSKQAQPADVAPGQVFDWVITLEQSGPGDLTGVVISDDVPAPSEVLGVTGDSPLACSRSGNSVSCSADTLSPGTYEVRVQTRAPTEPGPIDNVCVFASDSVEADSVACGGTVIIEERTTLNVDVSTNKTNLVVGENWTYTVTVRNDGHLPATNIDLEMTQNGAGAPNEAAGTQAAGVDCMSGLSDGRSACNYAALQPGESIQIAVPMTATAVGPHQLSAQAATTTLLTPDSVLQSAAGVNVGTQGVDPGPNGGTYPIPTLGAWSKIAMALMLMMIGLAAVRMTGVVR